MEKYGKIGRLSGRIRSDWGNTTRAEMTEFESIGLMTILPKSAGSKSTKYVEKYLDNYRESYLKMLMLYFPKN